MEVLREGPGVTSSKKLGTSFNPCFNGSVERGKAAGTHVRTPHGVSILVLMEVLREDSCRNPVSSLAESFNPCFNGSVERGLFWQVRLPHTKEWFQSLF